MDDNINNEINEKFIKLYPAESRFEQNTIEDFIYWCTEQKTSDITIQTDERVKCEIHGKLFTVTKKRLSRVEVANFVTKIYGSDGAIARLNSGEDIDMPWSLKRDKKTYRYRINMTAVLAENVTGFSITIRTINNRAPKLESLNLPDEVIDNLTHDRGLIIIVGATGSGKTTLLASTLDWRVRQPEAHLKVLTYEAPIEFVFDEVPKPTSIISQSEIGKGKNLPDFAHAVRNALRRKPSIIMLGEMRDKETIGEGVTASMTGHLVYGTLHANGVADAIRRMINVFEVGEKNARAIDILTSIRMIMAQMLVSSVDGVGRVAIREYLVFNEKIADELLEAGVDNLTYTTRKLLKSHGKTFLQDAQEKYDAGLISEKVLRDITKYSKGADKDSLGTNKDIFSENDNDNNNLFNV